MKAEARTPQLTGEIDEFWCSDCLTRALFERVVDAAAGSEWACTTCGAAYVDAIDLVVNSGVLAEHGVLVV